MTHFCCLLLYTYFIFIWLGFSSYLLKYDFFTPFSVLFLFFMQIVIYVHNTLLPSLIYLFYLHICFLMSHEGENTQN